MVRLATLDLLSPGVFNTAFPGLDAGGADASSAVTEEDIALVAAWRDLFEDLRAALSAAGADLDAVADASAELERAAAEWRTLDIPTFALCRRVEGFGVYTPFPANAGTYKLLAGRRHALVVYAEADHFTRRPVTRNGADAFEVALTQTLTLFHAGTPRVAADRDLVAWRTEPQRIADVSRRQRRDFYTVQVIRLPASLSVGSYRLKISIVDDASGETAEALLNIDVVADASAFESGLTIAPARDTPAR
jgi:hypothetical protein